MQNVCEKIYYIMRNAGVLSLVLGIVILVLGIVAGVLSIISGAILLRRRSDLEF